MAAHRRLLRLRLHLCFCRSLCVRLRLGVHLSVPLPVSPSVRFRIGVRLGFCRGCERFRAAGARRWQSPSPLPAHRQRRGRACAGSHTALSPRHRCGAGSRGTPRSQRMRLSAVVRSISRELG